MQERDSSGERANTDDQEFLEICDIILKAHDEGCKKERKDSEGQDLALASHPGTMVSIPFDHFNHSLRILEGAPFDLKTFFEVMAYLELGVLFDKLAIVPDTPRESDCFDHTGATSDFLKKDVLLYLSGGDVTDYSRLHKILDGIRRPSVVSPDVDYLTYFKNALAHRQMSLTCGYHVPFEILNPYLSVIRYEEAVRSYSLLLAAYEQLTCSLREEVGKWEDYLAARVLFIPPIMSLILSRCSSPKDIPQVFLDIRGEFEPLRRHFREYQARLCAPSSTVGKSLKAISRLEDAIRSLASKYGEGSNFVVSEWQDGLGLLPDADSLEQVDTGLIKFFLGKPMKWITSRIKNRKLLPLFNLRKDFYRTKDYPVLVQKVFRTTITERDVRDAYDVTKAFRRLVPQQKESPNKAIDGG